MLPDLDTLRRDFQAAAGDAARAARLWEALHRYQGPDPVRLAYRAAASALRAHHAWNPVDKLRLLHDAMQTFEDAIRRAPDQVEIRFLRFAIEHHLPGFLDRLYHFDEDKAVMIEGLRQPGRFGLQDGHLQQFIEFFESTGRFSQLELDTLRQAAG
ncbi:MAG: hypothetical protein NW241_10710 [Bacteroidia bacterium]|nr:hypothetical protein [Bacteroidia bacterium]